MNLHDVFVSARCLEFQLDMAFVVVHHVYQFRLRPTAIWSVLQIKESICTSFDGKFPEDTRKKAKSVESCATQLRLAKIGRNFGRN